MPVFTIAPVTNTPNTMTAQEALLDAGAIETDDDKAAVYDMMVSQQNAALLFMSLGISPNTRFTELHEQLEVLDEEASVVVYYYLDQVKKYAELCSEAAAKNVLLKGKGAAIARSN